jgi:hypothetical protein
MIDSALAPLRETLSRVVTSAVELLIAAIFALVALGFLVAALETWLSERYGPLAATLILAGAFFVLALVVFAIRMASNASARRKAEQAERERAERSRRTAGARSLMSSLLPLASLAFGRRSGSKAERTARDAEAKAERALREVRSGASRPRRGVEAQARRTAALVSGGARDATRSTRAAVRDTRAAVREGMGTFGPWTIIAIATVGGVVSSMALRRLRR